MNKLTKLFTLGLVLSVVFSNTAFGEPLSNQLQSQKSQLQEAKNAYNSAVQARQNLEADIEGLDNQIEGMMDEVDKNKKDISQTTESIKLTEVAIKKAEEDLRKEQDLFKKRLKTLYMNGPEGYLDVLFEAKSFSDFLSRADAVWRVIQFDKKVVANIDSKKVVLAEKQEALHTQETKLIALKSENENKLGTLKAAKEGQQKLIADAQKKQSQLAGKLTASQVLVNATLRQIAAIRTQVPRISRSRGSTPISDNSVIAYASNFLGTPYLWGGTSPATGFDCSGFTQYVYRHFGVSIDRTTYDQIREGYSVSQDELQPGDLVFFGRNGSPSHVGMYVGNGTYIHSPHTGDVIKVSPLNRSDYLGARRVR